MNALAGDAADALADFDREADLARVAAFDHTMRFTYTTNALHGRDHPPSVQYWRGRHGEVDFVFEIDETPVPIAMAYQAGAYDDAVSAVREFTETYETPVGFLLAGDTVGGSDGVETLAEDIVQLPYWFYLLLC